MEITCTCGKALHISPELVGKRVRCPKCGERLQLLEEAGEPVAAPRNQPYQHDDAPQRRPRQRRKQKPSAGWPVYWIGATCVLLVVGIGIGLVVAFGRGLSQPANPTQPGDQPPIIAPPPALSNQKDVTQLAFSADGKFLATAGGESGPDGFRKTIKVWNVSTGETVARIADDLNTVSQMIFSPDGALLATSGSGAVKLWDVEKKVLRHQDQMKGGNPPLGDRLLAFSPEGDLLVSATQGTVCVMDVASGKVDRQPVLLNGTMQAAAVPGKSVITVVQLSEVRPAKGALFQYNYRTKQTIPSKDVQMIPSAAAYSRDGAVFAVSSSDGSVIAFDAKTWNVRATLERTRAADNSFLYYERMRLSADGLLACLLPLGQGRPQCELWTVGRQSTRAVGVGWCADMAFAPDGKTLAVAVHGEGVKCVDMVTGQLKGQ